MNTKFQSETLKRPLGRTTLKWKYNIRSGFEEIVRWFVDRNHSSEDMRQWRALVNNIMTETSSSIYAAEFPD
jgi:hypothetical protein